MPSFPVIDPVPWPPHSAPVDLKAAAIAFADTRGPDVSPTVGKYRRIVQQLESRPVCALDVHPATPLGFEDGIQARAVLGRRSFRDLTLAFVAAGTVARHTLLDLHPRLAVVCSELDQDEMQARAPQVPIVALPETTPWGLALATQEWIDLTRRHVEHLAVTNAPAETGKVLVVDGSLPRTSDRNRADLVGVCKTIETDWLPNPDLLPHEAGWRSPALRIPASRTDERDILTAYVRAHTATSRHPYGHGLVRVEVYEDSMVGLDAAAAMVHAHRGRKSSGDARWGTQLAGIFAAEEVLKAQIPYVIRTLN